MYFQSKTEKVFINIEIIIFELIEEANLKLTKQFCFFGPNLLKEGISSLTKEKLISPSISVYLIKPKH